MNQMDKIRTNVLLKKGLKMTLRDRGLKKFRTVALQPEFVSSLRQLHKEQEYIEKPFLDEQLLEYFNQIISDSMEFPKELTVTYYNNHRYEIIIGRIHYFDEKKRVIRIVDKFGDWQEIRIDCIIDIQE